MSVHFMSNRDTWKTPRQVFQTLDSEFQFDFDPCPPKPTFDGLQIEWGKRNFVNPPYGNAIGDWLEKARLEQHKNKLSVFLIPSRTDTRWWHNYVMKADEIRFIKGRLRFDDQKNPAPFPSAIVVFRAGANTC
jgi:site-specific DNA-methyltransferase (adenine-specific)